MKPLVVFATLSEAAGAGFILPDMKLHTPVPVTLPGCNIHADILVTGPGSVATAFHLGRVLNSHSYDLLINAGICGSLRPELSPGKVVRIIAESFADMGAEDHDQFLDQFRIGLAQPDEFPYVNTKIIAPVNLGFSIDALTNVEAITVNKVHGKADSIALLHQYYPGASVESMEGAAFFYAARFAGIPFFAIRAISNFVEPRNRDAWQIQKALEALHLFFIRQSQYWLKQL